MSIQVITIQHSRDKVLLESCHVPDFTWIKKTFLQPKNCWSLE